MICTCQTRSLNVFDCPMHGKMLRQHHVANLLRDANAKIDRAIARQNEGDHAGAERLLDEAEILTDEAERYEGAVA